MKNFKSVSLTLFTIMACFSMKLALADVVVVVSPTSPLNSLTVDQASLLFLGKRSTFPGSGQMIPIDQSAGAAVTEEFYKKVTGKDLAQLKIYWSKQVFTGRGQPPIAVENSAEVKKLIADNPQLIGYIEKNNIDNSIKVILIP